MPQIQKARRRVGGSRVRQPEVPQGFFTADIRAEAVAAAQRQRSAAEGAQADIGRAGVIAQGARLADSIGELATNIAFRDAVNKGNSRKLAYDVNEITTVKEMGELVAKGAYGTKEGQRDIAKFASDFTDKMAKHKATFDAGIKDLPISIRDQLNSEIKLQSTKQNVRISLQQGQMVQDAGAANTRERIQFIKDQVSIGEITLESGQAQTNDQYTFGITNGYFVDSAATSRSEQADLNELGRLDKQRQKETKAGMADVFAGTLITSMAAGQIDYAEASDINATSNQTGSQKREVQSQINLWESARIARQKVDASKETGELWDRMVDPVLPGRDEIETKTNLSEDRQQYFLGISTEIAAARAKNELSRFEKGDPRVMSQVQRIVDTAPQSITTDQIHDLVGKGLSVTNARSLVRDREARLAPGATPIPEVVKNSRIAIRNVFDGRKAQILSGPTKEGQALITQTQQLTQLAIGELNALNDYNARLANPNNANATDAQHSLWVTEITGTQRQEAVLSLKQRFWNFAPSEQRLLVQEKINTLKSDGTWGNWTTEQQNQATALFERGRGINDTIGQVNRATAKKLAGEATEQIIAPITPTVEPKPKQKKPSAADPLGIR